MRPRQLGFTLIELAIVMVVLTILAAGVLVPLTKQIETRRIQQTNQNLATIQDALIGYAMSHPNNITCTCNYDTTQSSPYPLSTSSCTPATISAAQICPANSPNSTQPTASVRHFLPCPNYDGTGIEALRNAAGQCIPAASLSNPNQTPLLPWATLGLPPTDAWGNSYGYDVYADFANNQIGFGSGNPSDPSAVPAPGSCPIGLPTSGYIHIFQSCMAPHAGLLPDSLIAGQLAAVVISFGPNGLGAYNPANRQPIAGTAYTANSLPTATDELVNANTGGNARHNYISHPATDAGSLQGEFDDIIVGLPYTVLLNRVCPSGSCP